MSKTDGTTQLVEEGFPSFDLSDEALEGAMNADAIADYTHYGCTYGYCPQY